MRLDVDVVGAVVILLCRLVLIALGVVLILLGENADESLQSHFTRFFLFHFSLISFMGRTQRWRFSFDSERVLWWHAMMLSMESLDFSCL
jgi:hypothetical protein